MSARTIVVIAATALVAGVAHGQVPTMAPPRQVSHPLGDAASPSPDGKRLGYIVVVGGKEQLFVMNVDGSHMVQLTHDAANHEDPA